MTFGIDASRAEKGKLTGVEFYSINIIKALMPLIPIEWQVVLYSRGGDLSTLGELPSNWHIEVIKAPFNRGWTMFALSWHFLWNKPDIFFEPSHITPMFAPDKTIAVVHDTAWKQYPHAYSWYGRIFLNYSLKQAKHAASVIVPTDFVKQDLIVRGFSADRVLPIWHGIDHDAYRQYSREEIVSTLERYGLVKPYVLSVGRIEEKKNIGRLLEAWEHGGFGGKYDLVLVGTVGFGGTEILERTKNMPSVRVLGWCQESDVPHLYAGARALVYPTLYEGFGFPALQAAACGTPIVASRIGALLEILGNGDHAMWVDPDDVSSIQDGITRTLTDTKRATDVANAACIRAREFTWDRTAYATWQAIRALV